MCISCKYPYMYLCMYIDTDIHVYVCANLCAPRFTLPWTYMHIRQCVHLSLSLSPSACQPPHASCLLAHARTPGRNACVNIPEGPCADKSTQQQGTQAHNLLGPLHIREGHSQVLELKVTLLNRHAHGRSRRLQSSATA